MTKSKTITKNVLKYQKFSMTSKNDLKNEQVSKIFSLEPTKVNR